MGSITKLAIFDRYTEDYIGHLFECSMAIFEAAHAKGLQCTWHTSDALKAAPAYPYIQNQTCFHGSVRYDWGESQGSAPKAWKKLISVPVRETLRFFAPDFLLKLRLDKVRNAGKLQRDSFATDLEKLFQSNPSFFSDPTRLVLFHTMRLNELEALLQFLQKHPGQIQTPVRVLLRDKFFNQPEVATTEDELLLAAWFKKIFKAPVPSNFGIVSDNEIFLREFGKLTGVQGKPVPIPFRGVPEEKTKSSSGKIQILFLGPAHWQRGFPLVWEALKVLAKRKKFLERFQFHLQVKLDGDLDLEKNALTQSGIDLQIHSPGLDPQEYYRLLSSADIVLLPYSPLEFYGRTSGKFAEAYCAGKPCIVLEDTWLAAQLHVWGGGVILRNSFPQDLADVFEEIAEKGIQPLLPTPAAVQKFKNYHSAEHFLELLC